MHYVNALPESSRTHRHEPDGPPWDTTTELLATMVEELSRLSREAPIVITRPWQEGHPGAAAPSRAAAPGPAAPPPPPVQKPGIHTTPSGGTVANGMLAMIQLAAGEAHTVRSTDGE